MSKPLGSFTANSVHTLRLTLTLLAVIVGTALPTGSTFISKAIAVEALVPESEAFRAGLKVQWKSQMSVGGPNKLIDWYLQINENESTTYFVMEADNIREVVSNRQLNDRGEAFGIEGAQQEIDFRKELLETRMKLRGIKDVEIKVSSYTLPKSTLYTLSDDGVVTAIDADTGDFLWEQLIGDMTLNVVGLGASNEHVAVVVGSKVYCLTAAEGRSLWSKETVYVPSASPAVSDTNILVPLGNGRLQSFKIEDEGYGSNAYFASGYATARPLVVGSKVAWTTDSGQLNLATPAASKAVSFRLKAHSALAAAPTAMGNMVFAASVDGFIYGVDQDRGRLVWEVTTGASITQSPFPIGEHLYVVSEADQLFKIDAQTGQFSENWDTPISGIVKFLGATKKSVFALDKRNTLQVIDVNSAKTVNSVPIGNVDHVLTNYATDRIYIATNGGLIECVREASSENPIFYGGGEMMAQGSGTKDGSATKEAAGSTTKSDPFATGGADPFATDGTDPFATDDETTDSGQDDAGAADDDDGNPFN